MKKMYFFLLSMSLTMLLSSTSWATDYYVATSGSDANSGLIGSPKQTIQAAVTAASAGDVVIVAAGTYVENVSINKALTLRSSSGRASTIITGITNGALGTILIQATNITIGGFGQGFTINGIDNSDPALESAAIYIQGVRSNIAIRDNDVVANGDAGLLTEFNQAVNNLVVNANTFSGKTFTGAVAGECGFGTQFTAPNVPRQLVNIATGTGITFTSNNITGTAGSTSSVSGCETSGQGNTLVTIDANNATIRGNTFAGTTTRFGSSLRARGTGANIACNTFDNTGLGAACTHIVLNATSLGALGSPNSLAGIASQNTFNEGAYYTGTPVALQIYRNAGQVTAISQTPIAVNTTVLSNVSNTNTGEKFCSIQSAIDDANTVNGHTITVAAGIYNEDVTVNKQLTINGAGIDISTVKGPKDGGGATFQIAASNVVINGFTITRDGNNVADWDNANGVLNNTGVAIQGQSITNIEIKNNKFIGNRTGIDVNNSNGHNIHNNIITDNRTGLIFRNQTDNTTLVQNEITDNWTAGIVFLDASSGSNIPVQTAANSNFNNNKITGNWYAGIVDRQSGGSLPTPGSNLKNFSCNWYGSISPIITTANSSEPGYSAIIPVAYGGTATNPGGAPDIAGPASANISYIFFLVNGTDNDAGAIGFQPVPNSCSGCAGGISVQNTNTGEYFCSIQAAIDDANTVNGHTITVAAGTYNENVNITKSLTITGAGKGSNPATNTVLSASTACVGTGITVAAANVTVSNMYLTGYQDGVSVSGATNPELNNLSIVDYCRYGVRLTGTNQNVEIKQSTIQRTTVLANTVGIRVGTADAVNGMLIDECIINGNIQGMAVFQNTTPAAFDNITIQNSTISNNTQKGLYFEKLSNALLSNLTMDNNGTDAGYGFNNGIDINLKHDSYTNITIQNSDITNSGATGTAGDPQTPAAITIKARDDSPSYNTVPASLSGVILQNNKITGPTNGIRFGEFGKTNATPTNITLQNNDLSHSFTGKAVISRINGNIDMKCNWHGTTNIATIQSTFTTTGSGVINLITYLTSGIDDAPATGFQPQAGSCEGCNVGTVTIGPASSICSGTGTNITFTGLPNAVITYTINGINPTTVTLNGAGTASVATGILTSTTTYALVSAFNGICNTPVSGSAVITIILNTVTLTSGAATESQTVCLNATITSITYLLGGGATGAIVTGLPTGVNATVNGSTLTISGTPTVTGTFNYSIVTSGNACPTAGESGMIIVNSLTDFALSGGGISFCQTPMSILMDGSQVGVSYQLKRNNNNLGSPLSGTGNPLTFSGLTQAGTYTIVATTAVGNCSRTLSTEIPIQTRNAPTAYNLTGGGVSCGGTPVSINLANSQIGVLYQLKRGNNPVGNPVPGTGNALSFPAQNTAGNYTAVALTQCADLVMNNTVSITSLVTPSTFTVTGGGTTCGTALPVGLNDSQNGVYYQLYRNNNPVGTALSGTGNAFNFGSQNLAGEYTVRATGECGLPMNGSALIAIVNAPTAFKVTGGGTICAGGVSIGLNNSQIDVTYQLKRGNVVVTDLPGTGAPLSFENQTIAGNYTIVGVASTSANCSTNMNGTASVTVGTLPIQYNMTGGGSYCNNMPVSLGLSDSQTGVYYQLQRDRGNGKGFVNVGSSISGSGNALSLGSHSILGEYRVVTNSTCVTEMTGRKSITACNARVAIDSDFSDMTNGFAQVMPNPVSKTLHLKVNEAKGQKVNVNLLDVSGRSVLQRAFVPETEQHQEEFEVSGLSTGMYFIQVKTADKQATLKVVKVE